MKKILTIATPFLLVACGGSIDDPITPELPITYQFKLATQSMNSCGQTAPMSNYEVVAYANDGNIVSRHPADDAGLIQADFDQSHLNFAIIRDSGENKSDKQDLDITFIAQYPVGDLGILTVRNDETEGCECQTTTVSIQPGGLTIAKLNLPYTNASSSSFVSEFSDTQLCEITANQQALLVANHKENGDIYYQTVSEPSAQIVESKISLDLMTTGQLGREVTVNATQGTLHNLSYVTDNIYDYSVPDNSDETTHLLEHDRVTNIDFHAYMQQDRIGFSEPVRFWGVHVPLTDGITEISYSQPEFSADLLTELLTDPTQAYDLNGDNQRVVTGYAEYTRPDNSIDTWLYILPSAADAAVSIELPADYLETLDEGADYQALASYVTWELNEITTAESLDAIYQSDWLKVLLPATSPVLVRPPATYSYVAIEERY